MSFFGKIDNFLRFEKVACKNRSRVLFLIFILFFFYIINISSLFFPIKKSPSYDEFHHFTAGQGILSGDTSKRAEGNLDRRNIMPASALNVLISDAIPENLKSKILGDVELNELSRVFFGKLATIMVSSILAFFVFLWSNKLYGVYSGFLALLLYILDPNIIAHSRQVTQDIFGACSVFISIYYYWRYLNFGGRGNAITSIITFGISQITRFTALHLIPIYLILLIGFNSSSILIAIKQKQFKPNLLAVKKFLIYSIFVFGTTILFINLGYSFERTLTKFGDYEFESRTLKSLQSSSSLLRALPVPVPYTYLRGLDFASYRQETGRESGPGYLLGKLGLENGNRKAFKEYFIIAFLFKVPIATQLLILISVISLIRNKNQNHFWQNEAFLIIPSLFYFIFFSFHKDQIGIRYILMIFPFLFVLSGRVAIKWGLSSIRFRVVVVGLIAYLTISNLSYFPHYISYFNELLIDRKLSYKILADSNLDWGQNQLYIYDYLKKNPSALFNPEEPTDGLVVIGANRLLGITCDPILYQWIRKKLKPKDHVAYSHLVFDIRPQDLPK